MFRYRIYGQAFTIAAMIAGSYYYNADRILRKEYEAVKAEQKAKERNEAWIQELEFRDNEDKEEKERQRKTNRMRERKKQPPEREKGDQEEKGKGVILESVKEARVVQELKKVAQDTSEAVKDNVDTKKGE